MSRLIAKDGKLCIVSGRLVTDEGGAPCVCGGGAWYVFAPCDGNGPRIFVPESFDQFRAFGGFQASDACFVKEFGPGVGSGNAGVISADLFVGQPDPGALIYPQAGTYADPFAQVRVASNSICNGPSFCGTTLNRVFTRCDGVTGPPIVVDPLTRTSLDQNTCFYQGGQYQYSTSTSLAAAVPVVWSNAPCGTTDQRRLARLCADPSVTITYSILTRPSSAFVTMLYQGQRYLATDEASVAAAVSVEWSQDQCPAPVGEFMLATKCNTPALSYAPQEIVVAVNQSIGIGNGAVSLVGRYPNPDCPDAGDRCTGVFRYRPTNTPHPGPATQGAVHVTGTPCSLPDQVQCRTCPVDGDPVDPIRNPNSNPAGMTDGDRMLAAMGFDPEEERRKLLNGGDCGCSPQAGFYT